jgi:hypothetical protein
MHMYSSGKAPCPQTTSQQIGLRPSYLAGYIQTNIYWKSKNIYQRIMGPIMAWETWARNIIWAHDMGAMGPYGNKSAYLPSASLFVRLPTLSLSLSLYIYIYLLDFKDEIGN